jgi:putative transposase
MDGRGIGDNALQVYCSELAKEYPFAARLNSQARQTSADRTWLSIARFYKNCREKKPGKKGYPRFQHDNRSVEYKHTGWKLEPDGKHLTFSDGMGIGTVYLIGANPERKKARPLATFPIGQIKRVRLVKRADGYYAQVASKGDRQLPHEPTGKQTGIDVGLKSFYTDSEGNPVATPRYLRKTEKKLKRLHRRISRKKKGSKHRKIAIKQLAKGYLKVQRQRQDFARKMARALILSSDMIAYEDLKIAHLVKNHRLAKRISDASWGLFLSWVYYYGQIAQVIVVAVPPRFTTQDCVSVWISGAKEPESANTCVPPVWFDFRPGLERRPQYLGCRARVVSRTPYRWASGNGFWYARTKRFWTDHLYGCVRKGTRHSGWLKEESPWIYPGECQRFWRGRFTSSIARARLLKNYITRHPS